MNDARQTGLRPPSPPLRPMQSGLVRGTASAWLLIVAAGIAVTAGWVWMTTQQWPGRRGPLVWQCAGIVLATAVVAAWAWLRRRWLTLMPDGFVLDGPTGSRRYLDRDIGRIACRTRARFGFQNGEHAGSRLTLWIGLADPPGGVLRMVQHDPLGTDRDTGPVGVLLERLASVIAGRWDATLAAGRTVEGDGWALRSDCLVVGGTSSDPTPVPWDRISHVEYVQGRLRVWRAGRAEWVLDLPAGAWDVEVLRQVLARRVEVNRALPGGIAAERMPPLGRLVTVKRRDPWKPVARAICCALFGALLVLTSEPSLTARLCGYVSWCCGAILVLRAAEQALTTLRCHEAGIERHSPIRVRTAVAFHEVAGITVMDRPSNWQLRPGSRRLWFRIRSDGPAVRTVKWDAIIHDPEDPLHDVVRKAVAAAAVNLQRRLADKGAAEVNRTVRLLPDGVAFRPRLTIGHGP